MAVPLGAALLIGATLLGVAWSRSPAPTAAATAISSPPIIRVEPAPAAPWKSMRGVDGFGASVKPRTASSGSSPPPASASSSTRSRPCNPSSQTGDPNGIHYVSRDWDGGISEKGDLDQWAQRTLARVRATGFKGIGAWSNHVFHKLDVPMTRDLNVWQWMMPDEKRLYSPTWAATAERAVREQCGPLRENRNLEEVG